MSRFGGRDISADTVAVAVNTARSCRMQKAWTGDRIESLANRRIVGSRRSIEETQSTRK